MSSTYNVLGTVVPDSRAIERVTGATTYAMDIYKPGELIGLILRSPHAHAEIVNIDTSAAESLPGVVAAVTYKDVPAKPYPGYNLYVLDNVVRYVGEEVAAVAAETEEIAQQALQLIKVKYNVLPAVFDPIEAMQPGAPQLFVGEPGNLSAPWINTKMPRGDVDSAFAQADVTYENTYTIPQQPVAPLNRFAAAAEWDGESLTIYDSNQVIFSRQSEAATLFNLPTNNVRVIDSYMGGGFGEDNLYRYVELAALLAMKTGRTVKMVMPANYIFEQCSKRRHAVIADIKIGANKDGTITAMQNTSVYNKGAYLCGGNAVPVVGAESLYCGYRAPNLNFEVNAVYTNTPPAGAYSGYGCVQPNFAVNSAVDALAQQLGIDPTIMFSTNCIQPDDVLTIEGVQTDFSKVGGACYVDAISKGKVAINWDRWTPTGFATSQPQVKGGLGMALLTYEHSGIGGGVAAPFNSQVNINSDGTVSVYMGISDIGGGQGTVQAIIVAETLGAKLSDITPYLGDTNYPVGDGQYASQTTVGCGTASYLAAISAKQKLLTAAAGVLGVPVSNLDTSNSTVVNKTTGAAVPFAQIMAQLNSSINPTLLSTPGASIQALGTNSAAIVAKGEVTTGFAFGVCFAEVNVDTWTGKVKVVQLVFLEDMGQIVNLLMLENNQYGGILNSLGYALTEDFVIDKTTSQVISRSYLDYKVPTFTEVPKITLIPIQNPDPRTPYGMKGGGEAPRVAPHAAIANAITNATGLRFTSIPITPKMIMDGLKAKGGAT